MDKGQSRALDRRKLLADPVMVTTITVLIVFLTVFILYPLAILLVDSFVTGEGITLNVFRRILAMHSFRKAITNEEVIFEDGYIRINDKPGLGIDVNVEAVEQRPYHPINLRHYTGDLTEIRPKDDTIFYFKGIGDSK